MKKNSKTYLPERHSIWERLKFLQDKIAYLERVPKPTPNQIKLLEKYRKEFQDKLVLIW